MLMQKRQYVVETVSKHLSSGNKNIRNAAITILLKYLYSIIIFTFLVSYSISFLEKSETEGRIQCISGLSEVFLHETDS
jgi:hypothetical protein